MRRAVVTGLGAVTPVGNDARATWDSAVHGRSGIDFIQAFDASPFPVRIAAEVKDFDPSGLASDPRPFHEQMVAVLDSVSVQLARQLSPSNRAGGSPTPPGTGELKTPADAQTPLEKEIQKSKSNPPPDATAPTEVPVDSSSKKKQPKQSAPPPDATAPTEEPVDSKKK